MGHGTIDDDEVSGFFYLASRLKLDHLINAYIEWPHTCSGVCSCFMLLLCVISIAAGCMEMHLEVEGAWIVPEAESTSWQLALSEAAGMADKVQSEEAGAIFSETGRAFNFWYKCADGDGNLFQAEHLRDICLFERVLFTSDLYKTYCPREQPNGACNPPRSPLAPFYGDLTTYNWTCELLNSTFVAHKVEEIMIDVRANTGQSRYSFFMGGDVLSSGYTSVSRSMIFLGSPTNASKKAEADALAAGKTKKEAEEEADDAYIDEIKPLIGHADDGIESAFFKSVDEEMTYRLLPTQTSAYQVDDDRFAKSNSIKVRFFVPYSNDFELIQGDFIFAFGSIMFVYAYMHFHLNSAFMAAMGMFQIMCSLPLAGLVYQGILQVKFFQFLHILTIFLVLGIGADDIFVLTDTWRNSAEKIKPRHQDGIYSIDELKARMRMTYKTTASAIFNTSFTTTMAFMSCSVTKVMPMRTNGWYAAIAIVLNYILTVTLTPAVLMIHHYRLNGKRCCCPGWSYQEPAQTPVIEIDTENIKKDTSGIAVVKDEMSYGCSVESFLRKIYLPAMKKTVNVGNYKFPIVSFIVAMVMLGVGIQGLAFTAQLTPPLEEEQWFPDNHMHTELTTFMKDTYFSVNNDDNALVYLVWGLEGIDRSESKAYRPLEIPGTPIFDPSFDLTQPEAQQFILDTCDALRVLKCDLAGCPAAKSMNGTLAIPGSVSCVLDDYYKALNQSQLNSGSAFLTGLLDFRANSTPSDELKDLAKADWEYQVGYIGGQLKYFAVKFRSAMPEEEPMGTGEDVQELINNFAEQQRAKAPASAKGPYAIADKFSRWDLQRELLIGLFQGCAIMGPVCFIVLILATRNIVISIYAVLSVAFIVLSVLGFCKQPMGYSLGVAESIAGVIVIGYSVDYVVHLAHMYMEAAHYGLTTRVERTEFAILNMGGTVFAGAMTTAGAGVIMFLCFSTFFHKMALLISITIFYSFLFSLGFFISVLILIGPEGTFGDITCCCKGGQEATTQAA